MRSLSWLVVPALFVACAPEDGLVLQADTMLIEAQSTRCPETSCVSPHPSTCAAPLVEVAGTCFKDGYDPNASTCHWESRCTALENGCTLEDCAGPPGPTNRPSSETARTKIVCTDGGSTVVNLRCARDGAGQCGWRFNCI